MIELLLASKSPRRSEILRNLGFRFRIIKYPEIDEDLIAINSKSKPEIAAMKIATEKSNSLNLKDGEIALTADTIVVVDGEILGKPKDDIEAQKFLEKLNGKKHEVITGIALRKGCDNKTKETKHSKNMLTDFEISSVYFAKMSSQDIDWYISSGEPFGKAGGYAVQGLASLFIKRIDGCYFNVVGLPVFRLVNMLKKMNMDYRDFILKGGISK